MWKACHARGFCVRMEGGGELVVTINNKITHWEDTSPLQRWLQNE